MDRAFCKTFALVRSVHVFLKTLKLKASQFVIVTKNNNKSSLCFHGLFSDLRTIGMTPLNVQNLAVKKFALGLLLYSFYGPWETSIFMHKNDS